MAPTPSTRATAMGMRAPANFCRIRTPMTQVPLPLPELGILTFLSLKSCQSSPRSTRSRPVPSIPLIWAASYGGVAALYTLIHRPDLFGSAIIESPALEVGNGELLRDTEFLVRTPSRIAVGAGTAEDQDRFGSNAAYIRMV